MEFKMKNQNDVIKNDAMLYLAGQALAGMMANPEWMRYAKEEASEPGRGDVPDQFAKISVLYAERTYGRLMESR